LDVIGLHGGVHMRVTMLRISFRTIAAPSHPNPYHRGNPVERARLAHAEGEVFGFQVRGCCLGLLLRGGGTTHRETQVWGG